jgi:outer membrane lipoprotein carrier protein
MIIRARSEPGMHGRVRALARRLVGSSLVLAAGLVAAPVGAPAQQPSGAPDVRDLLGRAESRYEALSSMRAEFDQTIEIPLLGRKRSGTGHWYQKGRGRFKMEFTEPEGDLIVADGASLWLYYPSTHPGQVIRSTIDANVTGAGMVDLQGRIFEEAAAAYDAELIGREDVEGNSTWLVSLTPRGASPYRKVRVWIGAVDHLVRRFEIVEENETMRTVVLRDLRPDARIPDDVFRFAPPPGTDVFEG